MFQRLVDSPWIVKDENGVSRMVFKCQKCGKERFGSDEKDCEHRYRDYLTKKDEEKMGWADEGKITN